jgi:hypothetical protein
MFPHRYIYRYTWTSPDGKTHIQIHHILVDRRMHSNVLDVRSYKAADCDTDHYLVVAKVRERLPVNKQRTRRFHMESPEAAPTSDDTIKPTQPATHRIQY